MKKGFLNTINKDECFGCEACFNVCPTKAITMKEDSEGFRYPEVNKKLCINCGLCHKSCPYENDSLTNNLPKYVWGGYSTDNQIRFESTSGGAFSSIVNTFCDNNYVVFGATANGICVEHVYIVDINELGKLRKSKYLQSSIGNSYLQARNFLLEGKKVIFSGTPCQIAGLKSFLGNKEYDNLLTIEVVCEGVPSPLYIKKYVDYISKKYKKDVLTIDYRYKGKTIFNNGKWDFEIMKTTLNGNKELFKDRWFNPFWSIWLQHLMSRPSCYKCPFAKKERNADLTLGDLWGVHKYCPDLYGKNGGASLVLCNTEKGTRALINSMNNLYGHELDFNDAIKFQGPIRKHINTNENRESFMEDLKSDMDYSNINKKWAKKASFRLLLSKYFWGNRQKMFVYNLKKRKK